MAAAPSEAQQRSSVATTTPNREVYWRFFNCAEYQLIVEPDGPIHAYQVERDSRRTVWLEQAGYPVIRFGNAEVESDIDRILSRMEQAYTHER